MSQPKIRRALISVYDKTGLVDFARALVDEFGIEIISTGGTATLLQENKIPVTLVEEVTGFPEMLDGRVKTLHPKIHAAILADRDNPEHLRQLAEQGIEPIDMVVVNLYPFAETIANPDCTFDEAMEMIDIGGPCLLRAAAKNHKHVVVINGDNEFDKCLNILRSEAGFSVLKRTELARDAYGETSEYDDTLAGFLNRIMYPDDRYEKPRGLYEVEGSLLPSAADWDGVVHAKLRYGENPHQEGAVYEPVYGEWDGGIDSAGLVLGTDIIQGTMSFNNYVDANAAMQICRELSLANLSDSAAVFVKHTNPCGAGISADPVDAYRLAYLGDPISAFGGVLAQSAPVTGEIANSVMQSLDNWGRRAGANAFFAEVWVAPAFIEGAYEVIHRKKWGERVRLLAIKDMVAPSNPDEFDFKKITGGMLVQNRDLVGLNEDQWKVVTQRQPTEQQMADLRLAWLICKHTKSNAITLCADGMLIGNGAGQMSRVMSCRIATWLANENGHADKLKGAAAASDAFFPFRDGPDLLIEAGVLAIIQPGGSKRDADTIAACDERGVAMVFTGTRHFKH